MYLLDFLASSYFSVLYNDPWIIELLTYFFTIKQLIDKNYSSCYNKCSLSKSEKLIIKILQNRPDFTISSISDQMFESMQYFQVIIIGLYPRV